MSIEQRGELEQLAVLSKLLSKLTSPSDNEWDDLLIADRINVWTVLVAAGWTLMDLAGTITEAAKESTCAQAQCRCRNRKRNDFWNTNDFR